MDYSVFVPIHDNETHLPYTLPNILSLNAPETVLYFDCCTDNSMTVAEKLTVGHKNVKTVINNNLHPDYSFHTAYVKTQGIKHCSHPWILNVDADMKIDPETILPYLNTSVSCVCFDRHEYPISPTFELMKPLTRFSKNKARGLMFFNRSALYRHMDLKRLKRLKIAVDTYIFTTLNREYSTKFVSGKHLHLNPKKTRNKEYEYGLYSWNNLRANLFKMIVSKSVCLRFSYLRGYLHARFG